MYLLYDGSCSFVLRPAKTEGLLIALIKCNVRAAPVRTSMLLWTSFPYATSYLWAKSNIDSFGCFRSASYAVVSPSCSRMEDCSLFRYRASSAFHKSWPWDRCWSAWEINFCAN